MPLSAEHTQRRRNRLPRASEDGRISLLRAAYRPGYHNSIETISGEAVEKRQASVEACTVMVGIPGRLPAHEPRYFYLVVDKPPDPVPVIEIPLYPRLFSGKRDPQW